MQVSWISIVLLLAIFVAGPVVCALFSRNAIQRRAVFASFASLFVLWFIFVVVVEVNHQHAAIPFLAIASVLVPVVLYYLFVSVSEKRQAKELASKPRSSDEASPSQQKKEVPSQERLEEPEVPGERPASRVGEKEVSADAVAATATAGVPAAKVTSMWATSNKEKQPVERDISTAFKRTKTEKTEEAAKKDKEDSKDKTIRFDAVTQADKTSELDVTAPIAIVPVKDESKEITLEDKSAPKELVPAEAAPPAVLPKKPGTKESAKPSAAEPKSKEPASAASQSKPRKEVSKPVQKSKTPQPEPKPVAALKDEQARDALERKPASVVSSYEACSSKAELFSRKGHWKVSAALYEEAAQLASNSSQRVHALFESLSAYVKADKTSDAKRLVEVLQGEKDLNTAQSMKLAAVSKMLK